ncbi:MAG: phenylalanine--tRNA ligase subunit beta [Candidatus Aminicenantes bacterium]|nr:phenylalanine--tRNA ligase subunit beta [Candidatus Aminicenantes bacterium]
MPVVTISVKLLNQLLKKEYPMKDLTESMEQLGCDVEDTEEITLYRCPACDALNDRSAREEAPKTCAFCGTEQQEGFPKFASDAAVRIDLLADRPDLFNAAGLSRALRGYLGLETGMPEFSCDPGEIEVQVDPSVLDIRPYIVCAVAEMPPLDHAALRELLKLQENLHWGIGRDRKLASIGIYDLDTLSPPIIFKSAAPEGFKFFPLTMPDREMTPAQILKEHPKGVGYAHLLEHLPRYPLLIDSKGQTLSMPPIINSDETKCRTGTTRLFIDVTGLSEQAVTDALNILVCDLIELGGKVQTVKINYPDRSIERPDLTPGLIDVGYESARRWLGIDLSRDEFLQSIRKMRMNVEPADSGGDGENHKVRYPVYRSDIRHEVDIFEDIVIGYGLEKVPHLLVPTMTVGLERPEEKIGSLVREVMTGLGFTEIMTLNLNSEENLFTRLSMEPGADHVIVDNPKTINQEVLRHHLNAGIMETLEKNRKKPVPQEIFEIGTVTLLNPETETGVNEYRHLAFGIIGPEAGYAEGRAVLDSVLRELGWEAEYRPVEHPTFIEGRCAEVSGGSGGEVWARLGEIHPRVLCNFNLANPVVYCELRLAKVF